MNDIKSALPWDRQRNESSPAFAAFCRYRDAGVQRSLARVWATARGPQPGAAQGAVPGRWKVWSAQHRWSHRAQAWDDAQDEIIRERIAKAQQDARVRHARTANANQLALSVPAAAVVVLVRDHAAMDTVIAEARASVRGLLRLLWLCIWCARALPAVVQVERRALGLSNDVTIDIEDRRVDQVALAIAGNPAATELAIRLLDEIAREGVAA